MCKPTSEASPPLPAALLRKLQWNLLPVLWLGFVFNVINRSNLAFAQIQLAPDLGISQAGFGLAAGIFFCSYALAQVPSNMLLVHIGARRLLSAALVCWGVISAAQAFVRDVRSLVVLRFLLGLAQAGYYSGCLLYLRRFFPARESATAIALFLTSGAAGTIANSLSSGFVMSTMDGLLGAAGWRWLFMVQGIPPVLLGLALPLVLVERPNEASRFLSVEEVVLLEAALESEAVEGESGEPLLHAPSTLRATLCQRTTPLFMLQYFVLNTVTYTVMFFLPLQLSQIFPGLATWQIGLLNAVPAALKIGLGPPVATLADRHDGYRFSIAWGLFGGCSLAVLVASALMRFGPAQLTPLFLLLATLCEGTAVAVFWSVHHRRQSMAASGVSIALINSFGNLGGFAGTFVLGFLHDALSGSADASLGGVGDWAPGTAVIGLVFLLVTCASATLLADGSRCGSWRSEHVELRKLVGPR